MKATPTTSTTTSLAIGSAIHERMLEAAANPPTVFILQKHDIHNGRHISGVFSSEDKALKQAESIVMGYRYKFRARSLSGGTVRIVWEYSRTAGVALSITEHFLDPAD